MVTIQKEIRTMYVVAKGCPETYKEAFTLLESKLDSLKGRKFYGVMINGQYRACVALFDKENASDFGFNEYRIPGGKYAKARIQDWPSKTHQISSTFEELSNRFKRDDTRPVIEFYRSHSELVLLLPVK